MLLQNKLSNLIIPGFKGRSTEERPSLSSILLPDELIEAILLRLPVSCLLRFKSVSKSWLSLISNPQFAKSHFDLAAAPTHRLLLNCTRELRFQSLDVDSSPPNNETAVLKYLREEFDGYGRDIDLHYNPKLVVLGSCRGFLFLLSNNFPAHDFVVCNPLTGEHRRIPSSTSFSYSYSSLYGIGYDQSTDDYLLVSIRSNVRDPRIEVFSLKTNLPSSLTLDNEYQSLGSDFQHGLFLNGSLIGWLPLRLVIPILMYFLLLIWLTRVHRRLLCHLI
ncbi:F-box/kelch-repeat protein At3g06240-like [Lotus japonicus]|uniref:F-box/kelch-repeat protein At3g06240-like n=1 Tax=Lotus japonicus TaxID=34305 RepID=UPI0025905B20|nr:F-box/kelch-repeat protein At3g06240-like [Lotus japonicus]